MHTKLEISIMLLQLYVVPVVLHSESKNCATVHSFIARANVGHFQFFSLLYAPRNLQQSSWQHCPPHLMCNYSYLWNGNLNFTISVTAFAKTMPINRCFTYLTWSKCSELLFLAFTVYAATPKNPKNNDAATRKKHVTPACLLQTQSTFSESVMD